MNDFTPEKVQEIFADDTADVLENEKFTPKELAIAKRLLPGLVDKISRESRKAADASAAKQLEKQLTAIQAENEENIKTMIEEWKKKNTPPTPEELSTLLNQEYLEFPVKLYLEGKTKDFVIRELPQSAEKRFVHILQKKVLPNLKDIVGIDFKTETVMERIVTIVDVLPNGLDLLAELAALALYPRGDAKPIEWLQENISTQRMFNIVEAQFRANRLRDFTSAVSRVIGSFGQN